MRTWTTQEFQVQSRFYLDWANEPGRGFFMRRPRSRYEFTDAYSEQVAYAKAIARIEKLKKTDGPRDVLEYRILKRTKTVVEEIVEQL